MRAPAPAYHSDPAVRDTLVERLRERHQTGRVVRGPAAWNGDAGSIVGCLIESDDLRLWEEHCGLPQWLAVLIDALAAERPTVDEAVSLAVEVLASINPGKDLRHTGSVLAVRILEDMLAEAGAVPAPLSRSVDAVVGLHRRALAGDDVAPAEWRGVRKAASVVTDALEPDSPEHNLGTCAEAAAWDPHRSGSLVSDMMRLWQNALRAEASRRGEWTDEIDARIRTRLNEMFEVHMGGVQGPTITVFDMLEKYYPEDHKLVIDRNRIDAEVALELNQRAGDLLLEALRAA